RNSQSFLRPGRDRQLFSRRVEEFHHPVRGQPANPQPGGALQPGVSRALERARAADPGRGGLVPRRQGDRAEVSRDRGQFTDPIHSVAGTVRVATVYSVGLYELSSPLKRYLRTFPDVNIHLEYTRANKIYEDVIRGDMDLGIVAYPSKRPQILLTPFREDRLVLVCAPQHPFAEFHRLSIKRLNGEKFVGFERDVPTRRALDRIFRRHGIKVQYVMEVDNIETIKRVVEIGSGISIVPEPSVTQEVKAETLKAVQFTDEVLVRPLGIISKRARRFTPAVQEFIDFLQGRRPRGTAGEPDRTLQATA